MARRKLENWLKGLQEYVEETESPRVFWLWSGIFTLSAAMRRTVWVPFGLENIYPNLYVLFIAPPAARKANPVKLARKLLNEIKIPVSVDSTTTRALTQELVEISKGQLFNYNTKPVSQAPLAVISPEMSTLLARDPKGIVELLVDLYDAGDTWKYRTSGQGYDYVYGVCISCLIATTPGWFANNLPSDAIGGGYTSRNVIISASAKYKQVPIPPAPNRKLFEALVHDLNCVATLVGPFKWGEGAVELYEEWYGTLPKLLLTTKDERLHPYIGRIHTCALKTAMALKVSESDELVLGVDDLGRAIAMLEEALRSAPEAFGGYGRSKLGPDTERIKAQVKALGRVSLIDLLKKNFMNLSKRELLEIMESLEAMELVQSGYDKTGNKLIYVWKGGER